MTAPTVTVSKTLGSYILYAGVTEIGTSVVDNESTINYALVLQRVAGQQPWANGTFYWWLNVTVAVPNGSIPAYDFRGYSELVIVSANLDVAHESDGTKTLSVQGYFGGDHGAGTTNPGAITLTPLPRASVPTYSDITPDAGDNLTITTNRASSDFTHDIAYRWKGSGSAYTDIATGVGASTVWAIPMSLCTGIPAATSRVLEVRTITKNGATTLGTTIQDITIGVPASVLPDFTTVTHSEAVTLVATEIGAYVQGVSKLALAITGAAGAYGSTIIESKIEIVGQASNTINTGSGTTPNVLTGSGTVTLRGTIKDSRNRTKQKTVDVTVLAYAPPVVNTSTLQFRRATSGGTPDVDGDRIRIDFDAAVQSLLVAAAQKNALSYTIKSRSKGVGAFTTKTTVTPGGISFGGNVLVATYATNQSWDVILEVSDKLTTIAFGATITTAGVFLHLGLVGQGIGVGKFWEQGSVDALERMYQRDGKAVLDIEDVASTTAKGPVELATNAETQTGTDPDRAVTPAGLASRTATETRSGHAEIATTAETNTGTDDTRIVTPLKLQGALAVQSRPLCRATKSSAQSTSGTPGTFSNVLWNTEEFDNAAMHSTSSNTSRITAPIDGYYLVNASLWFATTSAVCDIRLKVNGTGQANIIGIETGNASVYPLASMSALVYLTAGQYIEVEMKANAASVALSVAQCRFEAVWMGA